MRPRIAAVLFALGTLFGFGSGAAHVLHALHAHHPRCAESRSTGQHPGPPISE